VSPAVQDRVFEGLWVTRFSSWAPGERESPALEFTEPLFRLRLSQISRMTIKVLHDLMPIPEGAKILFSSFRGEIGQQLKINKMLVEDEALMPAAFSLSVFNSPPALASMALKLTAGYSAVYTAEGRWDGALLAAAAQAAYGAGETVLVYADEIIPPEYHALVSRPALGAAEPRAFAFAALLSHRGGGMPSRGLPLQGWPLFGAVPRDSPEAFLKYLCLERGVNV
jgi:hypothetical protein